MNIINRNLLRFVLIPSGLYGKLGVNTRHLKAILDVKLMMDDRRPNTFQQIQRKKTDRPISSATLGTMLLAALMGLMFLISFMVGETDLTKFTFYFSFYVTVLASVLIADFTSVLIDIRDNFIILPKPVNDRTFVVARLLHIFIHVCKLLIPMILPAIIFLIINKGALAIIPFLFVSLMATLFTIFLINACYLLILKITTPSKFQSVISYIQIIFAIVFYAGYQLLPQLIGEVYLSKYEVSNYTGIIFLPTYWFAGAWQQLYSWNNSPQLWICLLLTLIVPLMSIWVVIKYFAPSFNQKLSMISGGTGESSHVKRTVTKNTASVYSRLLSRLFTKAGMERAGFLFTWKMMLRSRSFKLKVYPTIGYIIVIVGIMLAKNQTTDFGNMNSQSNPGIFYFLLIIYVSNIPLMAALSQMTMSEKYKAAWIFFIAPVKRPGQLVSGSVKAAIAQFFFPLAITIFILFIVLAGPGMIPNVLLGLGNELLITALAAYINVSKLPFSLPPQNDAGSVIRAFTIVLLGSVLAFLQFLLYQVIIVVWILTLLSFVAAWYVLDALNNMSWAKVINRYSDD